uniref:Uncharacterized protein n=1 Tax=Arundo donax TaxID=35708 RepID=A0A0A9CYJ0_ARUDO
MLLSQNRTSHSSLYSSALNILDFLLKHNKAERDLDVPLQHELNPM